MITEREREMMQQLEISMELIQNYCQSFITQLYNYSASLLFITSLNNQFIQLFIFKI